jgi:hypothetical protein
LAPGFCYDLGVQDAPDPNQPVQVSRWETFVWPRWLPVRLRMPLIAQVTGAVALTALIVGPWWARVPDQVAAPQSTSTSPAPEVAAGAEAPAAPTTPPSTVPASAVPDPVRPAHLNLDVRHSFKVVDFSVSVDGKSVVDTQLEGSGKRFKVFGKRSERGYTKTLELTPGVRLVKVRVRSIEDKFDQTRIERFDLGSASVAALRVAADRSGLSLVAERPPSPPAATTVASAAAPVAPVAVPPPAPAPAPQPAVAVPVAAQQAAVVAEQSRPATATVIEFLQSLRSMLIGIAGFVASTATAFVVQEWLRSRKRLLTFMDEEAADARKRRRRVQGAISTE